MNLSRDRGLTAHGLTELHVAAIHGQTRRVRKFLSGQKDKDVIDARDWEGTTPLMAAALTGRLAIARLLLRNGASSEAKDRRGRKALAYSRASLMKKKLAIYERLGLPPVTAKQIRKRKLIAVILRYPAALESCRRAGKHKCSRVRFYTEGRGLNVLNPQVTFTIAKQNLERATCGFISSATRPEVKTAAASGWQPNPARGPNVLDNYRYFGLVQDFARLLGFKFNKSLWDNNGKALPGHSGRYVACHAEKKMAVFWVIAALKAILNTTDIARVHELRDAVVPEAWRVAWIFLNHSPCLSCWKFLDAIKRATGIEIYVEPRPLLVTGRREGPAGCNKCPCHRCRQKFEVQPAPDSQVNSEERDKVAEHDDTDTENRASDRDTTKPGPDLSPGPDPGIGTDGLDLHGNEGQSRRARETTVVQPTATETPEWWAQFSETTGRPYGKPIRRSSRGLARAALSSSSALHSSSHSPTPPNRGPVQAPVISQARESQSTPAFEPRATPFSSQSSLDNSTPGLPDPPSMIAGRSGFFATPEPRSTFEIQIPRMHPARQAEYDRVSDISGTRSPSQRSGTSVSVSVQSPPKKTGKKKQRRTIRQAAAALDLKRFAYNASGPSAAGVTSTMTSPGREQKKAVASGKVTKAKKPRTRMARDDKLRAKSAFAKAVEHHQRKRAGKA